MKADIHIPFAVLMWITFCIGLGGSIRQRQRLEGRSLYGWVLLFCAACVFSLQGEYVELWLDQYFNGLPVTLYIKYFAMVIWFGMYYLIIKQIFVHDPLYRWLDWLFCIAIVTGAVSAIPVAMVPYGVRTEARDIVTGLRDGFLFVPSILLFVPATWKLSKQEQVNGTRIKQIAITVCYAAYSLVALANIAKALLVLMHQESLAQVEFIGALFMSICLIGFVLLLVPYRWVTILFYPGRLVLYWKLKRVEHCILQQVGAVSETPLFGLSLLRSGELELAIYRTTINILDYGALLSRTSPQQEQWRELQRITESGTSYSNLVAQLTKVQM